jgi:hypothetical protein
MEKIINLNINSCDRFEWINFIVENRIDLANYLGEEHEVVLHLNDSITADKIEPFHIVVLACFIELLRQNGCSSITINSKNEDIRLLLSSKLNMHKYFEGDDLSIHIDIEDDKILNLWKVVENMSYGYSISVTDYFKRNNTFEKCDVSGLQSCLNEIYANIADHSDSGDNAFSYISFNPEKNKIYIAACDFGLGIPNTLRYTHKKYKTDSEALRDSVNIGVTARSTKGNKGFGLDNIMSILSADDEFRIVSNSSLLHCKGNKNNIKTYDLNFDFKGTLIYFEISISSFPQRDIEENDMDII